MDLRSFAAILAQRQGGVRLKPGHSCRVRLTAEDVKRVFSEGTLAYASEFLTITIEHLSGNEAIIEIRRNL